MTALLKSLAVTPLFCTTELTSTVSPEVEKVAFKAVTSVPNGTVASMLVPEIVAVTSSSRAPLLLDIKLKAVRSFASEAATLTVTV